jgi:hypothetical protein
MARVVADNAEDAGALHDLALVADFLDAWSHLHVTASKLSNDFSSIGIMTGDLDENPGSDEEPNDDVSEFGGRAGAH